MAGGRWDAAWGERVGGVPAAGVLGPPAGVAADAAQRVAHLLQRADDQAAPVHQRVLVPAGAGRVHDTHHAGDNPGHRRRPRLPRLPPR